MAKSRRQKSPQKPRTSLLGAHENPSVVLNDKQKREALVLLRASTQPSSEAYELGRQIIQRSIIDGNGALTQAEELLFLLSLNLSARHLPGYSTLASKHIGQIEGLVSSIQRYVNDASQKRPLNFLMLASPGAGKSHFIKCVAAKLKSENVGAITFNMAGMQSNDDLMPPLDAARNLKMEDQIPLLFLDEFDSDKGNFALLLPLLWDGEINLKQRDLKLGKIVIVLAGSDAGLPATMESARSMRKEVALEASKVPDLLSRINGGVVEIPPFFNPAQGIDRRADKVSVTIELLRKRFGSGLRKIPIGLLRFVALSEFRYGVRSIAHLADLISFKKDAVQLSMRDIDLPLTSTRKLKESSLAYHMVHDDQANGVTSTWKEATRFKGLVSINHTQIGRLPRYVGKMPDQDLLEYWLKNLRYLFLD